MFILSALDSSVCNQQRPTTTEQQRILAYINQGPQGKACLYHGKLGESVRHTNHGSSCPLELCSSDFSILRHEFLKVIL